MNWRSITWTLILFLTFHFNVSGQLLVVNAGNDTTICLDGEQWNDSIQLGGTPTAMGGTPPYTYKWVTPPDLVWFMPELNKYTSFWLNDTTNSNPYLRRLDVGDSSKVFTLTVTDSLGESASATIKITLCGYNSKLLGTVTIFPTVGDTVRFTASTNYSCLIDSIRWDAAPNIISPLNKWFVDVIIDDVNFKSSDLTFTFYDREGCGVNLYSLNPEVYEVWPLGISTLNQKSIQVFPNPSTGKFLISENAKYLSLEIRNLNGILIQKFSPLEKEILISTPGVYIATFHTQSGISNQRIMVTN